MAIPGLFPRRQSAAASVVAPTLGGTTLGELLCNTFNGKLFLRGNNGADFIAPVAGRGYLAKDVEWSLGAPAALENFEFLQRVYLFAAQQAETIVGWVRVPSAYTPGSVITLKVMGYSPSTSNNVALQAVATLVRKGTDAITSTANQRTVSSGDQLLSTANLLREFSFALTDSAGAVGAAAVSAGDLIQIVLSRVTPTGTEDTTNDLRIVADNSSECTFN